MAYYFGYILGTLLPIILVWFIIKTIRKKSKK